MRRTESYPTGNGAVPRSSRSQAHVHCFTILSPMLSHALPVEEHRTLHCCTDFKAGPVRACVLSG